jgi:protein-L-isoaspartate O-methyltransferase
MADRQAESAQAHVRAQFDRQVAHYLRGSAMADQELLARIVRLARPAPGMRVLDVACGAGFLA